MNSAWTVVMNGAWAELRTQGFVVVRNFLGEAELDLIQADYGAPGEFAAANGGRGKLPGEGV
jgi:hypothetical protein